MRGLSEYPRMLFREGPQGEELTRVVKDATEKAAAIAARTAAGSQRAPARRWSTAST